MLKQTIADLIIKAIAKAQKASKLPTFDLPEINIEHPQNPDHGDYSCSVPLKLTKVAQMKPMDIAKDIISFIPASPEISKADVAPPGFINFTLKKEWLAKQVNAILKEGNDYGRVDVGQGKRIQIEFVSVNPTGPLHVGHGRGAVIGSTLCNTMTAAGFDVTKEYYFNDSGSQMDAFRLSLWARYQQALGKKAEMPEKGYMGQYMIDLAQEIVQKEGDRFLKMPQTEGVEELGKVGLVKILETTREDLKTLRVEYDVWYSEKTLYEKGQFDTIMKLLRKKGYIAEKDGAVWFSSTALGEDKDNVIVRSNGSPTYFAI